jgi:serine/threonine protein phosphatase PrpC
VNKAGKVTELSHDHKPDDPVEMKRIKADGGFVDDGRVQGIIAVSRAIGDWEYKNPDLLQQQMAKSSMKKKSSKAAAATSPTPKATGPYRNIEEAKKHQVSSYPDIKKVTIKPDHDFIVLACDGIWDCFTNEQAAKFVRTKRDKGPKSGMTASMAGTAAGKAKLGKTYGGSKSSGLGSSPLKISKTKSETSKKTKIKGDTSFIIEEMMDQGIAKGDITMSDGTGTDNMTCIIIQFRDESDVAKDESTAAESGYEKEEYKK